MFIQGKPGKRILGPSKVEGRTSGNTGCGLCQNRCAQNEYYFVVISETWSYNIAKPWTHRHPPALSAKSWDYRLEPTHLVWDVLTHASGMNYFYVTKDDLDHLPSLSIIGISHYVQLCGARDITQDCEWQVIISPTEQHPNSRNLNINSLFF